MRKHYRIPLVALVLAMLATVLVTTPAHADEVKQQTHLVAQFASGHTGWIKIALEKDPPTNKARAHAAIWCQNASGTKVQCGAVEFSGRWTLNVEYWNESTGWARAITTVLSGLDTDPPLTVNKYTPWECTGEGDDQYRAVVIDVRIQDAFGDWSGWKTRTHPTWPGSFC